MKKTEFIKSVYANVSTPPSVVLRILIGLNKEGLLPKLLARWYFEYFFY